MMHCLMLSFADLPCSVFSYKEESSFFTNSGRTAFCISDYDQSYEDEKHTNQLDIDLLTENLGIDSQFQPTIVVTSANTCSPGKNHMPLK